MIEALSGEYRGIPLYHFSDTVVTPLENIKLPDGRIIPALAFECDLDSVPRQLGPLYAILKNRTKIGAIVHDYLWRCGDSFLQSNRMFLEVMNWERVRRRYRYPVYWAVSTAGYAIHQGGPRLKRLNTGDVYTVETGRVPICPEVSPHNAIMALDKIFYLTRDDSFRVLSVTEDLDRINYWYQVEALATEDSPPRTGYVNGVSLIGKGSVTHA